MNSLYITGGRQRSRVFNRIEEEWNLYEAAIILRVDLEKETSEVCVDYKSPPEVCADGELPSFLFKAGTLQGNKLFVCTSTEVLIYLVPEFKRIGYVSLPCFNDLHHVCPTHDGNLLVANTGLDMVIEFTPEGKVLREWNVLGEDPWRHFSREIDYRKVASTKPHKSHPNYVFQIGNEVWVTRAHQRDCVSLTQAEEKLAIGGEIVHDGDIYADKIYFTQVDGHVVIANHQTRQVEEIIDLKIIDNEDRAVLGWCRGLLALDKWKFWIGFTRVRNTKFRENINWVKHFLRESEKPAHIALYDLESKRLIKEIDLEKHGVNVVFSILSVSAPAKM